jgi:hypothetical protein
MIEILPFMLSQPKHEASRSIRKLFSVNKRLPLPVPARLDSAVSKTPARTQLRTKIPVSMRPSDNFTSWFSPAVATRERIPRFRNSGNVEMVVVITCR